MGAHRSIVVALVAAALAAAGGRRAVAQPRPDLGAPGLPGVPKACAKDVAKAAQWFVRELDGGAVTVERGAGWQAWRGTTIDEDHTVPVLWVRIEQIDPSSKSLGAVSGWIELEGAPPGMAVSNRTADELPTVLPETHWARSTGRWRLERALVDGTPKEQAIVLKALDKCAAALARSPAPRRR